IGGGGEAGAGEREFSEWVDGYKVADFCCLEYERKGEKKSSLKLTLNYTLLQHHKQKSLVCLPYHLDCFNGEEMHTPFFLFIKAFNSLNKRF
ncbi:unnamed protein product, partial [Ceratitis capitata]